MAAELLTDASRALDANANPFAGAKWYFYATGTLTPQNVFADADLSTSLGAVVTADAGGRFVPIYFNSALRYRGILKDAAGNTLPDMDIDPINPSIMAQLGDPNGSDAIGFIQAGDDATPRTAQDKLREQPVSILDFAGTTDEQIASAVAYCKTLTRPHLIIPKGSYTITQTAVFDLPDWSTIDFIGEISTGISNSVAIRLGSTTTNIFGMTVRGLYVDRTSNDTAGTSIGIEVRNLVWSNVDVRRVTGFREGLVAHGSQGNGAVSYCEFTLGMLHDNRDNLVLRASNGVDGYCNENQFFGGSFNHSSGYPAVTMTNLIIEHYADNALNNNRFFCPSFEDNHATLAKAAVINGDNNLLFHPRMENTGNQSGYLIELTANSGECAVVGNAFAMVNSNISDLGSGNSWETREGRYFQSQTPDTAGKAVVRARGTSSGTARLFAGYDLAGVEVFFARADGRVYSASSGYFENGIRFSTSSGTQNDRGVFVGAGSPEGVVTANPGSLYLSTAGGAGATLYVKESGSGNTGWVAK